MVLVPVVAALAREAGEVRHGGTVVVRGGNLELIGLHGHNLALGVKQGGDVHVVEAPDLNVLIVSARALAAGVHNAEAHRGGGLDVQRHAVLVSLLKGSDDVAMAVVEGHGGSGGDVGQHGLLLVGQGVVLGGVLLVAGLHRAAVVVGAVLGEPGLNLLGGHADEGLLELVHLLSPVAGAHHIALAALALGLPAGDFGHELLFGVGGLAVDNLVMVLVPVVAALAREAGEMRHGGTVVVRGGNLELIDVGEQDAAFRVKDDGGDHLVEAPDLNALIVSARALAAGAGNAQTDVRFRSLGGLGLDDDRGRRFVRVVGRIDRVLDGGDDGLAGHGRGGDGIDVGAVRGDNLRRQLVDGLGADVRGLVVAVNGHGGDLVALHGDGDGQLAAKALGHAGQSVRLREGRHAHEHDGDQRDGKNLLHRGGLLCFFPAAICLPVHNESVNLMCGKSVFFCCIVNEIIKNRPSQPVCDRYC